MDDEPNPDHETVIVQKTFPEGLASDDDFIESCEEEMCYYAGQQLMDRLVDEERSAVVSAKITLKFRGGVAKMRLKAELNWVE